MPHQEVQLPRHVVFRILKHVPYKQRMWMRLVSKTFAAEALAATDSLVLQHTNTSTARTWLNDWIGRHGQLTSLRLEQQQYHWQLLSLQACPGLKSLQLGHIQVSLTLSQGRSSLQLLSATTGLTRLALVNVAATTAFPPENLMALTALKQLQELEVDATGQGVDAAHLPLLLRLPSPLIPCLTQVTHLALHHAVTELWALQQVSRLTGLSSLSIDASTARAPTSAAAALFLSARDVLSAVQPLHMLTSLCLAGSCELYRADLLQHFSTALQHLVRLELRDFLVVDPGLLAPLTGLQHLVASNTKFPGQAGTAELLAWLALQDLTYLDLSGALTDKHSQAPAAAYSALTASSNLQHLDVSGCCLPEWRSVWQSVFASHTRLPQLTFLKLNGGTPRPQTRSMHNIVAACPALQELSLTRMGEVTSGYFEWEIAAITGLSALTSLTASIYQQKIAAGVLPRMTALKALHLEVPAGGLLRRAFLPLTQLRQLELLMVTTPSSKQPKLVLRNKVPDGFPPDVWRQLRDWAGGAGRVANCFAVVYAAFMWYLDSIDLFLLLSTIVSICRKCFFLPAGDGPPSFFWEGLNLLRMFSKWYAKRREYH